MFEGLWTQEIHSHPAWVQNSVCGNLYCLADELVLECMSHLSQTFVVTTHWEIKRLLATNQQQWNSIASRIVNTINTWPKIFSRRKGLCLECPGRIPSKIPSHESVSCLAAQSRCCYWNNERKSTGQRPPSSQRRRKAENGAILRFVWRLCHKVIIRMIMAMVFMKAIVFTRNSPFDKCSINSISPAAKHPECHQ